MNFRSNHFIQFDLYKDLFKYIKSNYLYFNDFNLKNPANFKAKIISQFTI